MKVLHISSIVTALFAYVVAQAETITVSGDVSGIWDVDTVLVAGEIQVPSGESLSIEPGVDVIFQGHYKFIVDTSASLHAEGTETDSIRFSAQGDSAGWHGIRIYSAGDTCKFSYCSFIDGNATGEEFDDQCGGTVYALSSPLVLDHCGFYQSRATSRGGAIYCLDDFQLIIDFCRFFGNSVSGPDNYTYGGAIHLENGTIYISNSTFNVNSVHSTDYNGYTLGGALYIVNCEWNVNNCEFKNNVAISTNNVQHGCGGAISATGYNGSITNSKFIGNHCDDFPGNSGGALSVFGTNVIDNCIFIENSSYRVGAIQCDGSTDIRGSIFALNESIAYEGIISGGFQSSLSIYNCSFIQNATSSSISGVVSIGNFSSMSIKGVIFTGNVNGAVGINPNASYTIEYSCFYNNFGGDIIGDPPPLNTSIFEDPLLEDISNLNFKLSAGSPCIDAGDPQQPLDPDGTRSDIGAFPFDQTGKVKVRGICLLRNQTAHSGSLVEFRDSLGIYIDESETMSDGRYCISIDPGVYDICFSHFGFENDTLYSQNCQEPLTMPTVELQFSDEYIHLNGEVSGILGPYTYILGSDITVPEQDSLIIEPGAVVLADGDYSITVNGYLSAVGNETDSITFNTAIGAEFWKGINFTYETNSTGFFEYCILTRCTESAIKVAERDLVVSHCTFQHNVEADGACINVFIGDVTIDSCDFLNNESFTYPAYGGIKCSYSNLWLTNSRFIDNQRGAVNVHHYTEEIDGCLFMGSGDEPALTLSLNGDDCIVSNCVFLNNFSGGIEVGSGYPFITDCAFRGNHSIEGGAILASGGIIEVEKCDFIENSAEYYGGAVYLGRDATIRHCLFLNNSATTGGGLRLDDGEDLILENCTFAGNTASVDGGISIDNSCDVYFTNLIHWGNVPSTIQNMWLPTNTFTVNYCCFEYIQFFGIGNINDDPLFVDPENGDYHLQSISGSYHGGAWLPDPQQSPCIDTGDPSIAFDLEPIPNGDRINMGAYGNTAEASLSLTSAVKNFDAKIPQCTKLSSINPNPFNPTTVISYELRVAISVSLKIFDVLGREVAILVDGRRQAGYHQLTFDGSDLASGIYFVKFEAGKMIQIRKMVLIK